MNNNMVSNDTEDFFLPNNFENVTAEYVGYNGNGRVLKETGYIDDGSHNDEIDDADWLANCIGGNVTLRREASSKYHVHTSDAWWDISGENRLWEFKKISSKSSINNRIGEGILQILPKPGGLLLTLTSNTETGITLEYGTATKYITDKLKFYQKYDDIDVVLRHNENLVIVIRIHGRHEKK